MASFSFASETFTYVLVLLILPMFLTRDKLRSIIISTGIFIGAICCEILAPETYIGLPREWWPMLVSEKKINNNNNINNNFFFLNCRLEIFIPIILLK